MAGYHYVPAAKAADLLRQLGHTAEAAAAYRQALALALTANGAERTFLEGRLAACKG